MEIRTSDTNNSYEKKKPFTKLLTKNCICDGMILYKILMPFIDIKDAIYYLFSEFLRFCPVMINRLSIFSLLYSPLLFLVGKLFHHWPNTTIQQVLLDRANCINQL